jgi:amidase
MSVNEDITYLELVEVAELIRTRQVSSVEVTQATLDRVATYDSALRSYATVMSDTALRAASDADAEISRGHYRGPLHGVPFAVKDLAYTVDAPTTGGGTIGSDFQAPYDATVVTRLRNAGAVITGKLRMTEGAWTDHHPDLPVPINPWAADTWVGASSSGSGVATAAGLCFGSLGSDTGGSIRLPSSMTGLTGLKPTWGRVSRHGILELAASLDHIGPMARSAADCAAILGVIAGADRHDPTSSLEPVPDYLAALRDLPTLRLGVDRSVNATFDAPTRRMLDDVIGVARDLGWSIIEVSSPNLLAASADFAPMCAVETAAAHADTFPTRADEYGPALRAHIELGRSLSAVQLQTMLEARRAFSGRMERLMQDVDLLLLPGLGAASPTTAEMDAFGSSPDLLASVLVPTSPIDMAGLPTVTLPGAFSDRVTPIGFQLIGKKFDEALVLRAAHQYQSATAFHRVHPELTAAPVRVAEPVGA